MAISKKYSLRFVLTSLFAILILCVGGFIGLLNYTQTTKLLLSASDEVYDKVSKEIVLNYLNTYNPVFNSLELLSHSSLSDASTLDQRMAFIAVLSTALSIESAITAIQLGYENGDYFIIRKINTEELRNKFDAPKMAHLAVDNIAMNKQGGISLVRLYLNNKLQPIKINEAIESSYDPRTRPWYKNAETEVKAITPYYFYFMQKLGTTITIKMHNSKTVIATDITLENISAELEKSKMTPLSELYLITSKGYVVASSNKNDSLIKKAQGEATLKLSTELNSKVLLSLADKKLFNEQALAFKADGDSWQGAVKKIGKLGDDDLFLLMFTPVRELLKDAIAIAWNTLYLLLGIIVMTMPVVWVIAKRISAAMHLLAIDARQIMNFDFTESPPVVSKIEEVVDLANAQALMKSSLSQFISLINSLSIEKNFDSLLEKITIETLRASKADAVATYLVEDDDPIFKANALKLKDKALLDCDCLPDFPLASSSEISELVISDSCKYLYQSSVNNDHWSALAEKLGDKKLQLILLPLRDRQSEFMGMVVLAYKQSSHQTATTNHQQSLAFVQAFSGFAAVSLESKHLLKIQEDLLDAFIKLIAGAIDAKSPYTGGHCQRVPEIVKMLAQAACDSKETLFSDYLLNDEQWQELHIASWLHDCGKVTTPEYVVDKSTKLETIYDRIHEIRTRFEVLKRDAQIDYWKTLSEGGDVEKLNKVLDRVMSELDDDFAFVATCNQGGEYMEEEKINRLRGIADKRWMRTLNNRLGISWEEAQRMNREQEEALPVEECLLSDKVEHIIERLESEKISENNPWGFNLDVPEYKFNRGELYNMSVKAGTLTNEERYIINGHMIQTIKMLDQLPFPSHLKQVPAIAGGHHESMDGKGYPKGLSKEDMSLTVRMMAIADIFEALTASDRPYKKAKSLTASLKIMAGMRDGKHIDADLFDLFLHSGVYQKYAEQFLDKDQIDMVDISAYLSIQ